MDYGITAKLFGDALFSGDRLAQQKAYADQMIQQTQVLQQQQAQQQEIQQSLMEKNQLLTEAGEKMSVRDIDRKEFNKMLNQNYAELMDDIKHNHYGNFQSWLNYMDENGNNGYDKLNSFIRKDNIKEFQQRQQKNAAYLTAYQKVATEDPMRIGDIDRKKYNDFFNGTLHDLGVFMGAKSKIDHGYLEKLFANETSTWQDAVKHSGDGANNSLAIQRNLVLDLGISSEEAYRLIFSQDPVDNAFMDNYMRSRYAQIGQPGTKAVVATTATEISSGIKGLPELIDPIKTEIENGKEKLSYNNYGDFMVKKNQYNMFNTLGVEVGNKPSWTGEFDRKEIRVNGSDRIITDGNTEMAVLQTIFPGFGDKSRIKIGMNGEILVKDAHMFNDGVNFYTENGDNITREDIFSWQNGNTAGLSGAGILGIAGMKYGAGLGTVGGPIGTGAGAAIGGFLASIVGYFGGQTFYSLSTEDISQDMTFEGFYIANKWTDVSGGEARDNLLMEFADINSEKAQEYNARISQAKGKFKPVLVMQFRDKDLIYQDKLYGEVELSPSQYARINQLMKDQDASLSNMFNIEIDKDKSNKRSERNQKEIQRSVDFINKQYGGGDQNAVNLIMKNFGEPIKSQTKSLNFAPNSVPLVLAEIMVSSKTDSEGNELSGQQSGALINNTISNFGRFMTEPSNAAKLEVYRNGDPKQINAMYSMTYDQKTKEEIQFLAKQFAILLND
jgi:hypothetical protein